MTDSSSGKILQVGKCELELGGPHLGTLRDSNDIADDPAALHERIAEDGYLLIRGLQKRENVKAGRRVILENLSENGQIDPGHDLDDAVIAEGANGGFLGGSKRVTHTDEFLGVVESPEIIGFFDRYFGEGTRTFDFKWLRAIGTGGTTGFHYDSVYMSRGSARLHTVWTPFADISYEDGPLALMLGSHNLPSYEKIRATYGKMDVDRDNVGGWFSDDPLDVMQQYGGQLGTTEFRMGDVLIFGMFTMHGSIVNQTNRFRLSADTRYQPAADSVDERWVGEKPKAHYAWGGAEQKPMEEARAEWGV
ncbi:MAG: phytanoyl-CoA dioxygenase family protein [Verrucomicrobia bacterium]|nr:phytanoyl-CoA dioxygenase family protein [Verrucomicrobiota bacterium]MDA1087112.1 phytanoyl-CoA dioxygenase family protein [Verrucomicrobiota bacterium]